MPPFISNPSIETVSSQPKGKGQGKGRGKGKAKSDKTSDELALEYSKYEVNITQAKIRDQEATIKDLRFMNGILEARVADLEKKQKQDIYE